MKTVKIVDVILITVMFVMCFLTFQYIFKGVGDSGFYQNVIAALIGTLLTIIITSFLLKQQAKSDELKEQNVGVFTKKCDLYEEVTNLLIDVMEDGRIDPEETIQIKSKKSDFGLLFSIIFFLFVSFAFLVDAVAEEYVVVVATFGSLERANLQKQDLSANYNDIRIKSLQDKHIVMVAGFDNLEDAKSTSQKLVSQFNDCFIATYEKPTKIIDKPFEETKQPKTQSPGGFISTLAEFVGTLLGWVIIGVPALLAVIGMAHISMSFGGKTDGRTKTGYKIGEEPTGVGDFFKGILFIIVAIVIFVILAFVWWQVDRYWAHLAP